MPLIEYLSVTSPLQDKGSTGIAGEASESLQKGPLGTLNCPLPVSIKTRNALFLFLLFVTIVWFWQPLIALYSLAQTETYSHLLLIPWVSAYVFYLNRYSILASREWSPLLGSIMFGLGTIAYWLAERVYNGGDHLPLTVLGFVVASWGTFLFCYSLRPCRTFSFGLLFLLWMVPFPAGLLHAIIAFLQWSSAEATNIGFSLLTIPVIRDGVVFGLSDITIRVDEGCSGIRSTFALIIMSILGGHFFLHSLWAKFGISLLVIPLAIIKNAFRIILLSLLANYVDPFFITNSIPHDVIGHCIFGLSVIILISFVWLLRRFEQWYEYDPSGKLPIEA